MFKGFISRGPHLRNLSAPTKNLGNYLKWTDLTHCRALVNKSSILIKPAKFYPKSVLFLCVLKTEIPVVDKNGGGGEKL